jgi:hypothetical protein
MKNKERWRELCEQAAVEQDSAKLLELVRQINELLADKGKRLADRDRTNTTPAPEESETP